MDRVGLTNYLTGDEGICDLIAVDKMMYEDKGEDWPGEGLGRDKQYEGAFGRVREIVDWCDESGYVFEAFDAFPSRVKEYSEAIDPWDVLHDMTYTCDRLTDVGGHGDDCWAAHVAGRNGSSDISFFVKADRGCPDRASFIYDAFVLFDSHEMESKLVAALGAPEVEAVVKMTKDQMHELGYLATVENMRKYDGKLDEVFELFERDMEQGVHVAKKQPGVFARLAQKIAGSGEGGKDGRGVKL